MSSGPLVSIVTSCYNHEPYLDDYFNGLLAQTYRNIELILFDDESRDGSWAKIQSYLPRLQAAFPRVICERHANVGAAEELAQGIDRATGKYFCFLDSDDYYLPSKIEENVLFLEAHSEVGIVHSDLDRCNGSTIVPRYQRTKNKHVPTGNVTHDLLAGNFLCTSSTCCRTDLVRRYAQLREFARRGYVMGDYPTWLRMAPHTQFGYIPKGLVRYRVLEESASRSKLFEKRYRFARSTSQIQLDFIEEHGISAPVVEQVLREHYSILYYGGFILLRREDFEEGYKWLLEHYPLEFHNWKQRLKTLIVRNQFLWKAARQFADVPIVGAMVGGEEFLA